MMKMTERERERERFIELLNKKYDHFCDQCGVNKDSHYTDNLADYLIANGVIVLPCKVGDKVYTSETRRVKEWVITFCGKNSRGEYKMIAADDGFKNMIEFWDYDIGKTVFLTKEEAEKALKGGARK